MNWNSNVKLFTDGVDRLEANGTYGINPVITSLANRDQYLFEQLNGYSDKTILLSNNQPMDALYATGTPVYFDTSTGQVILKAAKGGYETMTDSGNPIPASASHLVPKQSSFVFGIVKQMYAGDPGPLQYGDVYVRGLVDNPDLDLNLILDTSSLNNGDVLPGPLYLSSEEAGKLSIFPSGASIFVGYYLGGTQLVLAPNIDSLNQLYFNYRVYLFAEPAGTAVESVPGEWSVTPALEKIGWINAADAVTNYGVVAPASAKFFYNLPTDSEIAAELTITNITEAEAHDAYILKKALPAHPATYVLLYSNGLLQTQYDSDHTNGAYIVNDYGIWWTSNETGYLPWNVLGSPLVLQLLVTKINPNYSSSVVTGLTSLNDAIKVLDGNGLNATTGDLNLKLNLTLEPVSSAPGTGAAVSGLEFDQVTGNVRVYTAPVVNSITTGPGLASSNNAGQITLALSNYKLNGEVVDIEPEESTYMFKGLHSYLQLKRPGGANQKIGFIGKFRLPEVVPANTNLIIRLSCFIDGAASTNTSASFSFEYSTSNEGSSISNSVYNNDGNSVIINGTVFNTPPQQGQIYKNGTVPYFSIPVTRFSAGSYINFRIARTYDVSHAFPSPIGLLGVDWIIE